MSYRAFKHLLGETSLERKCRFLLGAGILILIAASFYWYALRTEDLAYDQTMATGRLLVNPIIAREHILRRVSDGPSKELAEALLPEAARSFVIMKEPDVGDRFERQVFADFLENPEKS